jgi:hypoxanthine phosphoribosyltransferase
LQTTPEQAHCLLETAVEIHSAERVTSAVQRVASEITVALCNLNPLMICVLRGGIVFAGHLLTRLQFPLELDYADVTRYANGIQGGKLRWRYLPEGLAAQRDVLLVDDILDEGVTLAAIRDKLIAAGARRVWIAVLAEKNTGREKPVRADFVGLAVPDCYVFGFGMDVHGYWRNLPTIFALKHDE